MTNKEIKTLDDLHALYNAAQGKRLPLLDYNDEEYGSKVEFFDRDNEPYLRVYIREDLGAFHEMPLTLWGWFFPYGFKVVCN